MSARFQRAFQKVNLGTRLFILVVSLLVGSILSVGISSYVKAKEMTMETMENRFIRESELMGHLAENLKFLYVSQDDYFMQQLQINIRNQQKKLEKDGILSEFFYIKDQQVILVTGHRRESFGDGFDNICLAIRAIADSFMDVVFVYPVHLNPNVGEPVNRILGGHPRIHLIEPLSYAPFVWLMNHSIIVLTDSGGVQEEAPSLGKPVLVMRETTERPEGITAGNALLVGIQRERIVEGLTQLLRNSDQRAAMAAVNNPYGDGQAAQRIVDILAKVR